MGEEPYLITYLVAQNIMNVEIKNKKRANNLKGKSLA